MAVSEAVVMAVTGTEAVAVGVAGVAAVTVVRDLFGQRGSGDLEGQQGCSCGYGHG